MFSVPNEIPPDITDIVLIPSIAVFFGLLVYMLGEFNVNLKGRKFWKVVGGAILLLGALSGLRYFLAMMPGDAGTFYREVYAGPLSQRRMLYAHYLGFLLPLTSLIGMILISFFRGRRQNLMYDEF